MPEEVTLATILFWNCPPTANTKLVFATAVPITRLP